MAHRVGPKGQVVIEKEIRDRLGVQPGWQVLQALVDNHVRVYFVPPEHNRSLAGCLAPYLKRSASAGDEKAWDRAIEDGFVAEYRAGCKEDGDDA